MKISLRWLFDHIAQDATGVDVAHLVSLFNRRTAEIEHFYEVNIPVDQFFAVQVTAISEQRIQAFCPEKNQTFELSYRSDAVHGGWYLVTMYEKSYRFVALTDFGSSKEGLLTQLDISPDAALGEWRKQVQAQDYILEVDNKSINHRPDLWGHYGIAREVAAHLGLVLQPLDAGLANLPSVHADQEYKADDKTSLTVTIQDQAACARLSALRCNGIQNKPSQIDKAFRLALVDSRPINALVDLTNYVMFDIGQPMHVFDDAGFATNVLAACKAVQGQTLRLLDERDIALTAADTVITDGSVPVSLAGVMGGKQASFSDSTTNIIIESVALKASDVRKSAQRYKTISEASMRFSKSLDPMQTDLAIRRFVFLAQKQHLLSPLNQALVSVGVDVKPLVMQLEHAKIERTLGISLSSGRVIELLHSIGFTVTECDGSYEITVPTFRMSKDIKIAEDIIEEIGRLYGYEHIALEFPQRAMKAFDVFKDSREFQIKNYCAYAMALHEVREYAFYDESFLQKLGWRPAQAVAVKNPVSENWKVLVTSLIPHLLKNVHLNAAAQDKIRFFEQNAVWQETSNEQHTEQQMLAGIICEKSVEFYQGKALLEELFALLGLSVVWKSVEFDDAQPWYSLYKTAGLYIGNTLIGRAGMLDQAFIAPIVDQPVFGFEVVMQALFIKPEVPQFSAWSKYQEVTHDVSALVDESCKAADLVDLVGKADTHIIKVEVIDCFKKDDWQGKKALTLRYTMVDEHATMTQQELEVVTKAVETVLVQSGASIRI